jgi:hypothetical protein
MATMAWWSRVRVRGRRIARIDVTLPAPVRPPLAEGENCHVWDYEICFAHHPGGLGHGVSRRRRPARRAHRHVPGHQRAGRALGRREHRRRPDVPRLGLRRELADGRGRRRRVRRARQLRCPGRCTRHHDRERDPGAVGSRERPRAGPTPRRTPRVRYDRRGGTRVPQPRSDGHGHHAEQRPR